MREVGEGGQGRENRRIGAFLTPVVVRTGVGSVQLPRGLNVDSIENITDAETRSQELKVLQTMSPELKIDVPEPVATVLRVSRTAAILGSMNNVTAHLGGGRKSFEP